MPVLHKFASPTATAVTIDSFGDNLPFELGPWKGLGVASVIWGRDSELIEQVLCEGYALETRQATEPSLI